jgi:hypothetical protein
MLMVIDNEKEYSLGGESLIVQDREDATDCVEVYAKDFSEFERKVYEFLVSERS